MGRWIPVNGIVAITGSRNVVPLLNRGLRALAPRALVGFAGVTTTEVSTSSEPRFAFVAKTALGGCLNHEVEPGPRAGVMHGWAHRSDACLARLLPERSPPSSGQRRLPEVFDGEFCAARAHTEGLSIVRDPVGVRPLFVGRSSDLVAFASEPTALRAMGLPRIAPVVPGFSTYAARGLTSASRFHTFPETVRPMTVVEAGRELIVLLRGAVRRRHRSPDRIALAFSGGLDSSVLARILSMEGEVLGLSVTTPGAPDEAAAPRAAAALDISFACITLRESEIARLLRVLSPRLPRSDSMDLSIAIAIRALAREARQRGCTELVVGQLADELFGGYHKYLQVGRDHGIATAEAVMRADVLDAYEVGLPRDEIAAAPYAAIMVPFAALPVVDFALRLPARTKLGLRSGQRKLVLRAVGELLGVPPELTHRPKKALQYSTGLLRAVRRLLPRSNHSG